MPSYISHAIFASSIYNATKNNDLFKTDIKINSLKTFSLGIDLASLSLIDFHNIKTQELLLSLIKYVKDNNLKENSEALAFIYGHISHFIFDFLSHPYIYFIEKGTTKVNLISTHTMLEGYIDSYLCNRILNKDITSIKATYFNMGNIKDKDIKELISKVYYKVYNTKNVYYSYRCILELFTILENMIDGTSKNDLIKYFKFEKFLFENNLSRETIVNENRNKWMHPLTGEVRSDCFLDIYNIALERVYYLLKSINNYLYNNKSINDLEKLIPNYSYDTGVSLSLGKNMIYNRRVNMIKNNTNLT